MTISYGYSPAQHDDSPAGMNRITSETVKNEDRQHPAIVRFATYEVDFASRELRKHGFRIRLAEKPFRILEMLLERSGQVVTRHTLRRRLWPDTHVGYEHSLNTAVNTLRESLGDSAQNPRFIETLPRLGYRFIASVVKPAAVLPAFAKKMLIVLPFETFASGPEHDYFADGLTEELTLQLAQLSPGQLGVVARTSAIQYKETKKPIAEIRQELKVDYALEGSVRREGQHVRITAQLIDTLDESHRWCDSYDRELIDVLDVQAAVAREVGKALADEIISTSPQQD